MSPYFPFSARLCLNQHHWLAHRLRQERIDFQQTTDAFLRCRDPKRLQELADSLSVHDLWACGRKWLNSFTPFFTETERKQAGCQHRLFSRRYRLLPNGYRICLVFLKLFERIYAPLTAGLLRPFPADNKLQNQRLSQLDRLYQRVVLALDDLVQAVGLKAAA